MLTHYLHRTYTFMLKTFIRTYLLLLLTLSALALHAEPADTLSTPLFKKVLFEAHKQKLAGNKSAAYDLYNYALRLNPNSGTALYNLSMFNIDMRDDSLAILNIERAISIDSTNYWYHDQLVRLYYNKRRVNDAIRILENMSTRWPEKSDVLMMLLDAYATNNDLDNMIRTLDRIEVKEGKSEQLSMEKFRCYMQQKNEAAAFSEMKALAEEYPNDLKYQILIGDLYLSQDKPDLAYAEYKRIHDIDPTNININVSLAQYYEKTGQDSLYRQQMTNVIGMPSLDKDVRTKLLGAITYQSLQHKEDSTFILQLYDAALQHPQTNNDIYELLVRYMITIDMPTAEIKPYLHHMLEIDPESDIARQQLLSYAVHESSLDDIAAVCKPAVDYSSDEPVYYLLLGKVYYNRDSLESSVSVLEKGLKKLKPSTSANVCEDFHAILAELYYKLGQTERSFLAYDSCLTYNPNNANALNNYAYYLSLKKKNLDKAERMSRRSNELEPDNPTYLDTLAWVLFQLKRYSEAKEVMDKAVELLSPDEIKSDSDMTKHIKQINKKAK